MTERLPCLVLAALCLAATAGVARAADDHEVRQNVMVYWDTDSVRVISPVTAGRVGIGDVSLDAKVSFDLITAASVDLVTAASPTGFEEMRTEVDVGAGYNPGVGWLIHGGYSFSTEPDFETHSAYASASIDLFDRIATLGLSYSLSSSDVGHSGDADFSEQRWAHRLEVSWSHVLSPTLAADLVYGVGIVTGFQENPYRFVRLFASDATIPSTSLPESVPDLRVRHTATARLRGRLLPQLFGIVDYRLYADSWGVWAHTLTVRGALTVLDDQLAFILDARGYLQGAASFHQTRYELFPSAPKWRTSDKELGAMWTVLGGLRVEVAPAIDPAAYTLRFGVGVDVLHMHYLDFAPLRSRTGIISTLDVGLEL